MASSIFTSIEKCAPSLVVNSRHWLKPDYYLKYEIPESPNDPNGKGIEAGFESINRNLYEPQAHMVSFRVPDKQRLIHWASAFAYRYHYQVGDLDQYQVDWIDKMRKKSDVLDEIQMQITEQHSKQKLITVHIFFTTYLITVQGNCYKQWVDNEFEYLKKIVNYANDANVSIPTNTPEIIAMENTNVKITDQIDTDTENRNLTDLNLQSLEKSFCDTVVTLQTKLECFIKKTEEKGNMLTALENKVVAFMKKTEEEIDSIKSTMKHNDAKSVKKINDLQRDTTEEINEVKCLVTETQTEVAQIQQESQEALRSLHSKIQDTCSSGQRTTEQVGTQQQANEPVNNPQQNKEQTDNPQQITEQVDIRIYTPDVTITNRFDALDPDNTSLKQLDASIDEEIISSNASVSEHEDSAYRRVDIGTTNSQNEISNDQQILMLFDSHGNDIVAHRIYKNKDVQVKVLGQNRKNIKGAKEYLDRRRHKPVHILLCIGSNDLSAKSVSSTVQDLQHLLTNHAEPGTNIHVLPAFERTKDPDYNQKVRDYNHRIQDLCTNFVNCQVVHQSRITAKAKHLFTDDGIHFTNDGRKELVKCIKSHLNPILGMKPYTEYGFGNGSGHHSGHGEMDRAPPRFRGGSRGAEAGHYPREHRDNFADMDQTPPRFRRGSRGDQARQKPRDQRPSYERGWGRQEPRYGTGRATQTHRETRGQDTRSSGPQVRDMVHLFEEFLVAKMQRDAWNV